MTEPRVKSDLWIRAQIRLCDIAFVPATIARRGDPDAGQVLIKRNLLNGTFVVYARTLTLDGALAWRQASGPEPVDEAAADKLLAREADFDPDVWILEIEDPNGRYRLDGPLV